MGEDRDTHMEDAKISSYTTYTTHINAPSISSKRPPLPRLCAAEVFVDITIFCHLLIGVHLPEAILLTKCSQFLLQIG